MDRYPIWKLRKNPFWRLKHPQQQKDPQQQTVAAAQQVAPNYPDPTSIHTTTNNATTTTDYNYNNMGSPTAVAPVAHAVHHVDGRSHQLYAYDASENVSGTVTLTLPPGKKQEHLGIKIQFIGRIDMGLGVVHEGRPHYDFISLSKELIPPGVLYQSKMELPFSFKNMDKEFESYSGRNVAVRYFVRVQMHRKFLPPIKKEQDVWVQICTQYNTMENHAIKMEVGIEDCLHIEFEYDRRNYHLTDVILGKIHFLLVRIKIKHMELAVVRQETCGEGVAAAAAAAANPQQQLHASQNQPPQQKVSLATERQTLVKYEIMDGVPVKGEVIPVRLSLKGVPADLTPTYTAANNRFAVRYFLNLVLVDEEDRRYFKQQEIILWRNELG